MRIAVKCGEVKSHRREYSKIPAIRAGAKSAEDFELFEHLLGQRKAMRASAREPEGEAREVARNMARIYDVLLKYGRFFEPSPRPTKYRTGEPNQCYGNSLDLVIAHDELSYCEGYVVIEHIPFPMEHSWCITEQGNLVDVTLKKPGLTYFGVVFNSLFAATRDLPLMESVLIENASPRSLATVMLGSADQVFRDAHSSPPTS
jgi:hypothetical protein